MTLKTVEWKNNSVIMIDQTKLPGILEYVTYTDYNEVANAIRTLVVRGAPAIGVSGAFGLALAALQSNAKEKDQFKDLVTDNNNFRLLNVMSNVCYEKIKKDQKGLGVFMDVLFRSCKV